MSEFLEIISELRPKNGQKFAIADVNDLRGGYIQVDTIEEMNALLTTNKLKYGMLCYVKNVTTDLHMYIYRQQWEVWEGQGGSGGGGLSLVTVQNLEELETKTGLQIKGQIVYVNDIDDLRFWNGQYWESFRKIYIQNTPPDDKGGIWIDTSESGFTRSTDVIQEMIKVINILQQKVNRLMYMQTEIDPGDFTNNQSTIYEDADSEEPQYEGSSEEEDNQEQFENGQVELIDSPEPDNLSYSPNTKVIKVKSGTQAYMKAHSDDFAERELLWCYDTQTLWIKDPKTLSLIKIGATGTGGDEEPEIDDDIMDGIIQQTIGANKRIMGIEFADMQNTSNLYMLRVKNGELKLIDKSVSVLNTKQAVQSDGLYNPLYYPVDDKSSVESPLIYINMVYCGGDSDKYSYNPVSHNFIELCNISTEELNLNGLYLHYTEGTSGKWVTLPLTGRIHPGNTFLIRGAQCSVYDTNTTIIKVGEPDMYWTRDITKNSLVLEVEEEEYQHSIWDDEGYLKLSYNCSIYLSGGYQDATQQEYSLSLATPFDNAPFDKKVLHSGKNVAKYFIDLLGIGTGSIACATPFANTKQGTLPQNCLIFRTFSMDPVKQALKGPKDLDNNKKNQWSHFNLANINSKVDIQKYTPKNSKQGKNIFFNKADFVDGPNVVICTLGYDAHKTRCFNWISKGYYDEFIKIWKDSETENNAQIFESFKEGDNRDSKDRNWDSPIYNRIRNVATNGVDYTVHKFIMDFPLENGVSQQKYYYKVGRDGAWSSTHSFTIRSRASVIQNGFQWVQVTDQQGFHDEEYETWGIVSDFIKQDADNDPNQAYDWIMNTGDQTQNGNRMNEWLAYYRDSAEFYRDKEQMFVIGNNDLCSADPKVLGKGEDINKVNPENINFFFTYEHPFGIPQTPNGKYIPSVFSFVYGNTYFLGMNSEFTTSSQTNLFGVDATEYVEGAEQLKGIYAYIKQWCDAELTHLDNQIEWKVAFTHDNPFTLLTKAQIYGNSAEDYTYLDENLNITPTYSRKGSHLNSVGNYWFSKFLEDNNFRICIGGHKHTYTCSRPMRDNSNNRMMPYVYDPDYIPEHEENGQIIPTQYPSWYNDLPEIKSKLMQFGSLYDGNDNELTYVRYVTLQASGFKTTSNKELPTGNVPWLQHYYPATPNNDRFKTEDKNSGQNYPHYILWRIGEGTEKTNPNESVETARQIVLGRVYRVYPNTFNTVASASGWTYTYNVPYSGSQLIKVGGNGGTDENIIVEQSYA